MSQPEDSPYADLFNNIPDDFLEDITLITRIKTGEDSRNNPEYSEEARVHRGLFQQQAAPDRVPEEGGPRPTTQVRIFLPLRILSTIDFQDLFNVPGAPDPSIWQVLTGSPTVIGGQLNIGFASLRSISQLNFKYAKVTVPFDGDDIFIKIMGIGNQYIQFKSLGGPGIYEAEWKGPDLSVNQDQQTLGPFPSVNIEIHWTPTEIKFYFNSNLFHTVTDTDQIMNEMAYIYMEATVPTISVDSVTVENVGETIPLDIQDVDLIEAHGQRWAIIQHTNQTHLQNELLVQEVIP